MAKQKALQLKTFSIRALLVATAILSIWLAWLSFRAQTQKSVADWLRSLGSEPYYSYQRTGDDNAPGFLTRQVGRLIGVDYAATIDRVQLAGNPVETIDMVSKLRSLRWCELQGSGVTNIEPLSNLKQLEFLSLGHTNVADMSPASELVKLQRVEAFDTKIDNLRFTRNLKQLTGLNVMVTAVDDVSCLKDHPALQRLNISSTAVVDIAALHSIPTLVYLDVYNTNISDDDIDALQLALPNCKIRR